MPTPSLTSDQLREAVEAVKLHGSIPAAAQALGINENTFRFRYRSAVKRGFDDALVHEAPAGHSIKGVSTLYDAAGNVAQQWIKTRSDEPTIEDTIEVLRAALDDYQPPPRMAEDAPEGAIELATIFPIADAHFGLYAYGAEAGEDYDLTIADTTNREAFTRLMAATPPSSEAVILGLGDLLHADDTTNRTARSGNALDVDTRHSKVLKTAVLYLIHATELALQRHGHVTVRNLPGNHDLHSAFAVTMALWAWFRDEPRVTVDTSPSYFWWWTWGATLLGATHGDMTKMAQLPLVMAATNPADWGATKFRYAMTGHVHHKSAIETGGVIVESFQSTSARDAWHQASGFRSGRSMTAVTFHRDKGEISRQRVNIV
jgi:hypothetical protein